MRSAREVRRGGYTLSEPVDFDRYVIVIRLREDTHELRLTRIEASVEGGTVTAHVGDPCDAICGGATSVLEHVQECAMAHEGEALLVARPLEDLVLIDDHVVCPPLP
jgi:hypothetical protein